MTQKFPCANIFHLVSGDNLSPRLEDDQQKKIRSAVRGHFQLFWFTFRTKTGALSNVDVLIEFNIIPLNWCVNKPQDVILVKETETLEFGFYMWVSRGNRRWFRIRVFSFCTKWSTRYQWDTREGFPLMRVTDSAWRVQNVRSGVLSATRGLFSGGSPEAFGYCCSAF